MDAKLFLEYVRVFIWPLIVLLVVLLFRGQIMEMISSGDFQANVFGVQVKAVNNAVIEELKDREKELKRNIDALNRQLSQQQDYYNELLAQYKSLEALAHEQAGTQPDDPLASEGQSDQRASLAKATQARQNLEARGEALFSAIQTKVDASRRIVTAAEADEAAQTEREAFEALLAGEYQQAATLFQETEQIYPSYHNASEIDRLLDNNLDRLLDPKTSQQARREIFSTILEKYTWGMPPELQKKMKKAISDP